MYFVVIFHPIHHVPGNASKLIAIFEILPHFIDLLYISTTNDDIIQILDLFIV